MLILYLLYPILRLEDQLCNRTFFLAILNNTVSQSCTHDRETLSWRGMKQDFRTELRCDSWYSFRHS
jgi:hypothetical protein